MSAFTVHNHLAFRTSHPDHMAPTGKFKSTKRANKFKHRSRKNRVAKRSSPKSPLSTLVQKKAREWSKQGLLNPATHKPKAGGSKSSGTIDCKHPLQWPSSEPLEKNCLQRDPMPANYVFVPRGDVFVTRNCRSKTKELHHLVYKVYDNRGKEALGLRIPADVYKIVLEEAKETAESRAEAVKLRDEKELARSREILRKHFPLMPDDSLETILTHAYLKGSGRVGRTSTTSDESKALLAVEAHIRHVHTPYDSLLRSGKPREMARKAVWGTVKSIRNAWAGDGAAQPVTLPLRKQKERSSRAFEPKEVIEID
ncbi:hypothetical protein BDV18DRAFT_157087 [Aspergillus unguis]